jgi:hypothetical protein
MIVFSCRTSSYRPYDDKDACALSLFCDCSAFAIISGNRFQVSRTRFQEPGFRKQDSEIRDQEAVVFQAFVGGDDHTYPMSDENG